MKILLLFILVISCSHQPKRDPSSLLQYQLKINREIIPPFNLRASVNFKDTYLDHVIVFLVNADGSPLFDLEKTTTLKLEVAGGKAEISKWQTSNKGIIAEISPKEIGSYSIFLKEDSDVLAQIDFKSDFNFHRKKIDGHEQAMSVFDERIDGADNLRVQEDETGVIFEGNYHSQILNQFSMERVFPHILAPHRIACDKDVKSPSPSFQATRIFEFQFEDQATQNTSIYLRDDTSDFDSRNTQSSYFLFPRKNIPHYRLENGIQVITLTTGEEVSFDLTKKEFNNIFSELPIDYGPQKPDKCTNHSRQIKKYPTLIYQGKGLMLRVNANAGNYLPTDPSSEGSVPLSGNYGEVGTKGVWVFYYDELNKKQVICKKLFKKDLFHLNGDFKFEEDQAFADLLQTKCGLDFKNKALGIN